MHTDLVQDLRYKLQKRVRRINSTEDGERFLEYVRHLLSFLESQPLFNGVLETLERQHHGLKGRMEGALDGKDADELLGLTESEQAASAYFLLHLLAETHQASDGGVSLRKVIIQLPHRTSVSDGREARQWVFDHYVEFLYDFIDEHVDDQRALLALLERYKHRCEWFERKRLFEVWEADTKRGERELAEDLYAYLYDQGMEFTIEPYSVSGEADLVAAQTEEEPLIADAKIFDPEKGKGRSYIADGFHQVYTYTQDHNQPFGYLVIFNTVKDKLNFALSDVAQSTPYVAHNRKTIFFLEVDIYPYEQSASQRGKLNTHEITKDYLIREAELPVG